MAFLRTRVLPSMAMLRYPYSTGAETRLRPADESCQGTRRKVPQAVHRVGLLDASKQNRELALVWGIGSASFKRRLRARHVWHGSPLPRTSTILKYMQDWLFAEHASLQFNPAFVNAVDWSSSRRYIRTLWWSAHQSMTPDGGSNWQRGETEPSWYVNGVRSISLGELSMT